jgi:Zn-dependent protease
MGWSLTIGRIAGTAVRLHFTFLLLVIWIGISDYLAGGARAALLSVVFILLIFACVTAHEFGHILTARRFGVNTPQIILSPIGGIAAMDRIPDVPWQELLVAIAGPLVNVAIALVLIVAGGGAFGDIATFDFEQASLLQRLTLANVSLVVFNLIPAFPMDGGRVLRALLSMMLGAERATAIATRLGQACAFAFVALGMFYNPILLFVGVFLYFAAASEEQAAAFKSFAHDLRVADAVERPQVILTAGAPLSEAIAALLSTPQRDFPVVDDAGRPVGLLDREALFAALKQQEPQAPISQAMRPAAPLSLAMPLEAAADRLRAAGSKAEIVCDANGGIAGLLTVENIAEMMMVNAARPGWNFTGRGSRP